MRLLEAQLGPRLTIEQFIPIGADRDEMGSLADLTEAIAQFAAERDWDQFHSPKNLAMALTVEAAELLEHFQWLTEQESSELASDQLVLVAQEIADVQIYLIRLAQKLGVDILAATEAKLEINRARYPVDQAKGSARKYTAYARGSDDE